ncbi:hypothetical protein C6501_06845 [Candidatus Poribacteria bacterium]|nr:MAG: hypothetical protein C6501_06845 [Candidatus Poribacteria bacterium]
MNEQEGVDFLLVEHAKTLDLIQHYDNIRVSHMKFAFSYHSVVGTVAFAIYRYLYLSDQQSNNGDIGVPIFLGGLLVLAFLIGFATVAIVAQNRSYFVIAARQANTIRGVLFKRGSLVSSIESVFPTDPNEPKMFNPKSTHLVTLFLLGVVNSISFGFGILFFVMAAKPGLWFYFFLPITCGLLLLIGQFLLVKYVFLKEKSS